VKKSKKEIKNITASVRARLLNIAKQAERNFDAVLLQYFQERFLYRLSISAYQKQFVLKGALVLLADSVSRFRPTKDIDLSGRFAFKDLKRIMSEICALPCEDGVQFDIKQMSIEDIAVEKEYNGFRLKILTQMGVIKKKLQLDIGIGDKIYPKPVVKQFPGLLDLPVPNILFYPKEAIIAEKLETIIRFNALTSRMKDFYDILFLAQSKNFNSHILWKAIHITFVSRKTNLESKKIIFQLSFKKDKLKHNQWMSFLHRNSLNLSDNFSKIVQLLEAFIDPIFEINKSDAPKIWQPNSWHWL
jgi:hypothetical protein